MSSDTPTTARPLREALVQAVNGNPIPVDDAWALIHAWDALAAELVSLRERAEQAERERDEYKTDVGYAADLFKAFIGYRNRPIPAVEHRQDGDRWLEARKPLDTDYLFFPYGVTGGAVGWTRPWKQLSGRALRYWWDRVAEEAGVRYRSLHMARHSLATDLATAGEDLSTIQDWLGHADPKTTKIYVHNSRSRLQRGRQALDAFRKGQAG